MAGRFSCWHRGEFMPTRLRRGELVQQGICAPTLPVTLPQVKDGGSGSPPWESRHLVLLFGLPRPGPERMGPSRLLAPHPRMRDARRLRPAEFSAAPSKSSEGNKRRKAPLSTTSAHFLALVDRTVLIRRPRT